MGQPLIFSLFNASYLCSRFIFCGCHEVYMKCLTNKTAFFSVDGTLSSLSYMTSVQFLFPFYVFVVSIFPFL